MAPWPIRTRNFGLDRQLGGRPRPTARPSTERREGYDKTGENGRERWGGAVAATMYLDDEEEKKFASSLLSGDNSFHHHFASLQTCLRGRRVPARCSVQLSCRMLTFAMRSTRVSLQNGIDWKAARNERTNAVYKHCTRRRRRRKAQNKK